MGAMRRPLPAGALAVLASRPAAGPTLAFLELLLGPANAALSRDLLLGILDPADELVEVYARLDEREYPKAIAVSDTELAAVNLEGDRFHPEWNYTIKPRVDC